MARRRRNAVRRRPEVETPSGERLRVRYDPRIYFVLPGHVERSSADVIEDWLDGHFPGVVDHSVPRR